MTGEDDHFDLNDFKLKPAAVGERVVGVPKRVKKRSQHFVMIPRSRGQFGVSLREALMSLATLAVHGDDLDDSGGFMHWRDISELARERKAKTSLMPSMISPFIHAHSAEGSLSRRATASYLGRIAHILHLILPQARLKRKLT